MKKLTQLMLLTALTAGALLADQWVGWLTDQQCAKAGSYTGDHKKCLDSGQPIVFVNEVDKKIYMISDPDKVKAYAGKRVSLTGTAKGETIQAESVTEAHR